MKPNNHFLQKHNCDTRLDTNHIGKGQLEQIRRKLEDSQRTVRGQ